jgi:RNA polymerase sigma factor (sigma-70 family)
MANTPQLNAVLQRVRNLADRVHPVGTTDGELLEAFRARGDQAAFATLVHRHGPMVLGVGRRVLRRVQDAEDVYQATFLLLARKADSLRNDEAVCGWLHAVALRLASQARTRAACRSNHERRAGALRPTVAAPQAAWNELQEVLDEALRQVPAKYRRPLVLVYLEGKGHEEAARELGCSVGTLGSWLLRGRKMLRARLVRRGLTLSAGALATALLASGAPAAVPRALADGTVRAALQAGPAQTTTAAALARGVLGMPRRRLTVCLALSVGVAALTCVLASAPESTLPPAADAAAQKKSPPPPVAKEGAQPAGEPAPPGETMTVLGRVLDADGRPLAGAPVAVATREYVPPFSRQNRQARFHALGHGKTGADGRFQLRVPRTSSNRQYAVHLLGTAPGHGLGLINLELDAARQEVTLRLRRERVLRGRLIDLQGVAAAGVRVRVKEVRELGPPAGAGPFVEAPEGLAFWPAAAQTDAQGRVELRGLAPDQKVTLVIADERFAQQTLEVSTSGKGDEASFRWPLAAVQHLEGRVVFADTGRPVPNARLRVESLRTRQQGDVQVATIQGPLECRTDGEGRFHINPFPGDKFSITAFAPAGGPYLSLTQVVAWRSAAVKQAVEVRLPRGTLVRGTVKEAGSGKPVAGARIYFHRRQDLDLVDAYREGFQVPAITAANGSFRMAVQPVPGTLVVLGTTPDYVHVATSSGELQGLGPRGSRYYPDALHPLNLKAGATEHEVALTLRRGVTVRGKLAGPDGQPVPDAVMFCHTLVGSRFTTRVNGWRITDGSFELPGCDPDRPVRALFLAPKAGFGAAVELSGKRDADRPVTVRLQRCGSATVRLVDKKGKPLAGHQPSILLILTPGGFVSGETFLDKDLGADAVYPPSGLVPSSDAAGRLTLPCLIPGATYRLTDWATLYWRGKWLDFRVESGQQKDLGDFTIPEPQN